MVRKTTGVSMIALRSLLNHHSPQIPPPTLQELFATGDVHAMISQAHLGSKYRDVAAPD